MPNMIFITITLLESRVADDAKSERGLNAAPVTSILAENGWLMSIAQSTVNTFYDF